MKALPSFRSLQKRSVFIGIFGLLFAIVGVALLVSSSALTPTTSFEAGQGAITSPATTVTDATASGGSAAKFNAASSSPSGETMPVGNLPGFTQNMAQDFKTTATSTSFDSTYANSWCGYDDGTGGKYFKSPISAHDGIMDIALDGTKGAAGSFGPPGKCWSSLYGRYSMRARVVGGAGNGSAVMVWPSSDIWSDGEIDYPESSDFSGTIHVYHHPTPCDLNDTVPPPHCGSSDGLDTGAKWNVWHTFTTEWTPTSVKYYLDNVLIKTVTHDIPTTNHRYTLQVAPTGSNPQTGNMQLDWVTVYSYTP